MIIPLLNLNRGLVHPDKILVKGGAKTGDAVFITKRIGVGIISTAVKAGAASEVAVNGVKP